MKKLYLLTTFMCAILHAQTTLEPQYVNPVTIRSGAPPMNGPTIMVEGQPHVSAMSSGYNLPIKMPNAVAGLTPDLMISYNSGTGNEIMGMNWTIIGTSIISRGNTILGYDGEIKRHNLNSNIFSLDGERLVFRGVSPQYGDEYTTLNETYKKVYKTSNGFFIDDKSGVRKYYGTAPNAVMEIEDDDGNPVEYAWYLTKILDREGGNVIEYEYEKDIHTGEILLSKILYNFNVVTDNYETEIEFTYMQRFDEQTYFLYGNKFQATRILKEINVIHMGNSTPYSSYVFDYSFDQTPKIGNDVSRLVQINVEQNGETLTPILITYPAKAPEYEYRPVNINVDEGDHFSQTIFIDVDNDGYDDIITLHRNVTVSTCWHNASRYQMRRHRFVVKLNRNNGDGTFSSPTNITPEFSSQLYLDGCQRYPFVNLHTGDFNGDGLVDVLVHQVRIINEKNHHFAVIYGNRGNGQFQFEREFELFNLRLDGNFQSTDKDIENNLPYFNNLDIIVNDFDGDGITDVGIYREVWNYSISNASDYIYNSSQFAVRFFNHDYTSQFETLPLGNRQLMFKTFGDFNGDGVQDILFAEKNRYHSHIYTFVNRQSDIIHSNTLPNRIHATYAGDFNGDGITDLLTVHDNPNTNCDVCEWRIRLFNEKEFEPNQSIEVNGNTLSQSLRKVMDGNAQLNGYRYPPYVFVNDIDGDGRSDISLLLVISYNDETTDVRFVNLLNKVTGWERTEHLLTLPFGRRTIHYIEQSNRVFLGWFPGDITARNPLLFRDYQLNHKFHWTKLDDQAEQSFLFYLNAKFFSEQRMIHNDHVKSSFRIDFRPNDMSNRVDQIQDGKNTLTTFFRDFGNRGIYEATESSNYPIIVKGAIPSILEYRFTQTLWNGKTSVNFEESNKNMRINMHGFGVHGFGESRIKDNISNLRSINTFELINTQPSAYINVLVQKEEYIRNRHIVKKEFQYDHSLSGPISASNMHYFNVRQVSARTFDYIKGITNNESFSYDNYGNVLTHETQIYDGTDPGTNTLYYTELEEFDNYVDVGYLSYPARYKSKKITKTIDQQPSMVVEELFDYENTSGNMTFHTLHPGTPSEIETQFIYDHYGNVTEEIERPAGLPQRTITKTFSDNGLFVLSKTNTLGWKSEWTYDMFLQLPISKTDKNNRTTNMAYDFAGRIIEINPPNQNTEEWVYEWDVQNKHPEAITVVKHFGVIDPEIQNYFDALDRKVLIREKGRGNYWYATTYSYNAKGLLESESTPYRDGQTSPIISEYTYDALGRKTKIESAVQETSFSYPSERVTVKTNDKTSVSVEKEFDPLDNVIKITDAAGTIEYSYNSFSLPIVINPPVLDETLIEYDEFGRRILINDPAAGRVTYGYDALNRQIWHRDARGNETEITYDELNRKLVEETESSTYVLSYDNQLLGKQDNVIVTGDDEHEIHYEYDQNGNIIRVSEVIDNELAEFHYGFNANDQLFSMVYPNGFTLAYNYNQHGLLMAITSPSEATTVWEWDEDDYFGNTSRYTYGNQIMAYKNYNPTTGFFESEGNPFWGMEYTIDANSLNITSRSATHNNLTETFIYDALDRLEEYSNPQTNSSIVVDYDNIGAINLKTDAGDYTNNTSTAAVEEISQTNSSKIPEDPQNISYNCFNSVSSLSENGYTATFSYGTHFQRVRMNIKDQHQNTVTNRFYFGNGLYERDWHNGGWRNLSYVEAPTGTIAVFIEDERTRNGKLFFLYTDYLQSINAIADLNGQILEEFSFDAWGNRRDPMTWENTYPNTRRKYNFTDENALWGSFYRGYTGHEHLDLFGIINMNGRLYDPVVGKMLSPDTYVQSPEYSQNFNRYSYCYNNPLSYTDPSGEIIITKTVTLFLIYNVFFTEYGYDIQKSISPVAIKFDFGVGTHSRFIGVEVSYGVPQILPISERFHNGIRYYDRKNQLEGGWVTTSGKERGFLFGLYIEGETTYSTSSGKHNQTIGTKRFGVPGANVKIVNDLWGDGGDRWRTGGGKLNIGNFSIGVEIKTGDPGKDNDDRESYIANDGKKYYEKNKNGDDPDNIRQGLLFLEFGGIIRIGIDSESVRRQVQDKWIHDRRDEPRFKWVDYPNRFYFQIGTFGNGLY
ncbi:MAG: VCBS repeat-containing protein [Cryomorphaceae bacterium]|nr:VCBS repeat-containing protein [Cryomorphaceae bacterium]